MTDKRRLIFSIVQFLNREVASDDTHSEDAKESLEVASQCLQTAYSLTQEDKHLEVDKSIEDIFREATKEQPLRKPEPASTDNREKADKLKADGNEMMRKEQFEQAIELYTSAIELDPSNQVYYCNRAAAHSKLNNHHTAVEDCRRAIDMEPNYSKAYGRMGLAYSSLDKHKEAVDCFKQALELEPENESYSSNLQLAQEKLQTAPQPQQLPGGIPNLGQLDINNLLGNQRLMDMATSMLTDPNMQSMMGQLMGGGMGGAQPGGAPGPQNMEGLLQAGQRLAEQMQQSNPELVEQLRQQMQGGGAGGSSGEDGGNADNADDGKPPPGTS